MQVFVNFHEVDYARSIGYNGGKVERKEEVVEKV